jgi:DNA-binding NtrC family response regulator
MRSQILFVSGDRGEASRLTQMLHELPLVLDHAMSVRQARSKLGKKRFNVVLTEAALPDGDWLDVLRLSRDTPTEPQVIVTDAQADARFWAEALNLGAYDMLAQPFFEPEVRRILSNVCSRPALARAAG